MSVQACRIFGYGYKFPAKEKLFSFLDEDSEYDFCDITGLNFSYYNMYDTPSDEKKCKLMVIVDGMGGEYKCVMFVTQVIDMYDSHGFYEQGWVRKFKDDEYVRMYAKKEIETLLQRELGEPQEIELEHYS